MVLGVLLVDDWPWLMDVNGLVAMGWGVTAGWGWLMVSVAMGYLFAGPYIHQCYRLFHIDT